MREEIFLGDGNTTDKCKNCTGQQWRGIGTVRAQPYYGATNTVKDNVQSSFDSRFILPPPLGADVASKSSDNSSMSALVLPSGESSTLRPDDVSAGRLPLRKNLVFEPFLPNLIGRDLK